MKKAVLVVLLVFGLASLAGAAERTFKATLSGAEVVPPAKSYLR